jgi:phosphotransferase system enzyme I (PtsI)
MQGKEVVIRTLDIGADKQCAYFHLDKEANPALGYRAIRICLTQTDIFKTQLRAILRASAFGKAAIMLPMITSVKEVRAARAIYDEVKAELAAKKIPYAKDIPFGIMIETPAAALCSAELAQEVDFFSIGTNDLTQYTLAIDRQNDKLDKFFDAHHPAVLKLIELTAKNAHAKGIWCGICGELGADQALTETFLNYGIDELSVSPGAILPLRKHILELP